MAILLACAALAASLSEPVRAVHASSGLRRPGVRRDEGWIFPGEYESHQAMWMLWPTYENKAGLPSTEVAGDLIAAMSGHVHVNLAVQDRPDEAAARGYLVTRDVPLDHVHFFRIPHLDLWARDMGPQFTRSRAGLLRVNDWNFNFWGYEEPDSFNSTFEEPFDRRVARLLKVPCIDAARGRDRCALHPRGRQRLTQRTRHDDRRGVGGHAAQSRPRSLLRRPGAGDGLQSAEHLRAQPGLAGVPRPRRAGVPADARRPQDHLDSHWRDRRHRGVPRCAWPAHSRARVPRHTDPHAGVYTMFGVNGHTDEFLRFVGPDTVVLAQTQSSARVPRTRRSNASSSGSIARTRPARTGVRHHFYGDDGIRPSRFVSCGSRPRCSRSTSRDRATAPTSTSPPTIAGKTDP